MNSATSAFLIFVIVEVITDDSSDLLSSIDQFGVCDRPRLIQPNRSIEFFSDLIVASVACMSEGTEILNTLTYLKHTTR